MAVNDPTRINLVYAFETGSGIERFTEVGRDQTIGGNIYRAAHIKLLNLPTFSDDPSEAEIDIEVKEDNVVAQSYISHPPPYSVELKIYEYDRDTLTLEPYWTGVLIRPRYNLVKHTCIFHCKTDGYLLERDGVGDSLSALSRYSIFDTRSGLNIESLRKDVTVVSFPDPYIRDVVVVSGITEDDQWFRPGIIVAPDGDMRSIIDQTGNTLTLNGGFPSTTLNASDPASLYPGDDLTFEQWNLKYGAPDSHGGWPFTPTKNPAKGGVI